MTLPTLEGVRRALTEIRPYQSETPLIQSALLSDAFDADVWLKNETVAPIGCFKLRGALTDILRAVAKGERREVVTSSSGNHGQGVAYAARILGLPVTIFLPEGANPMKQAMIGLLGAKIQTIASDSYGTKLEAQRYAAENGCYFVDDGSSTDLSEGAGTVGLEIAQSLDDVKAVFLPVGDAALINGAGCALKALHPEINIIGVQALGAPAYAYSRERGMIVEHSVDTIADGLATRAPAPWALEGMMTFVDRFVLVSEEELLSATHSLAIAGHILAEPSGAATLAAAWRDRQHWRGQRIVLVVTGANVEAHILRQALEVEPLWALPRRAPE
jgi:threonine dehydratase